MDDALERGFYEIQTIAETDLEGLLFDHLQPFLLELGRASPSWQTIPEQTRIVAELDCLRAEACATRAAAAACRATAAQTFHAALFAQN